MSEITMPAQIQVDSARLAEFCRRHHIRKLAFFGSVVRGDFSPNSDVDVLYEFEEGHAPGWEIMTIEEELSSLLGRPVDLVPAKFLNPWIRERVLAEAEVQYAR
jgi:predicted nucleotidyltransferase